jgi:cell division protein FtsZ
MHQPEPKYLSIDRPTQTGQPHLQRAAPRPAAAYVPPPAAVAPAPMPAAAVVPAAPIAAPPPAAAVMPPVVASMAPAAPIAVSPPPAPLMTEEMPITAEPEREMAPQVAVAPPEPGLAAPVEAELPLVQAVAPPPPPAAAVAPPPAHAMPAAAVSSPSQHDWRLSQRPTTRPASAVRAEAAARSPNIFQRITGLVGGGRPATSAPPPAPVIEPVMTRPVEAPPAPTPLRPVASSPQPKIAGLDPADRAKPARDEDDLQIPAFLRRQAN